MSDSEEEVTYFGTPLEPYDEDAFPKKRPITIEEQVAKDAQGRRRFHGAFTGGFSAGFYNTVGSLEGWAPAEFKSSRGEKAQNKLQKPEDFMDDEDVGEFGIAPQAVRATDDYATGKKRKKQVFSDGPIPGQPVLETLLQAGNETVGYFLMKNMNRKKTFDDNNKSGPKVYGCVMPKDLPEDDVIVEHPQYPLHEIYKQCLSLPKCNTFGLGYIGLDKSHISLFQPAKLMVRERNNKKLSISGQAFGVGAFEDDDEDIYVKDDMSRYDFELSTEAAKKKAAPQKDLVLDVFVLSKTSLVPQNSFPPPMIPGSFTGKHNIKKSRFEPVASEVTETPERRSVDASLRAKYLGEENAEKTYTPSNQQHKSQKLVVESGESKEEVQKEEESSASGLVFDRFVSAQQDDDPMNILKPVERSEAVHGTQEMHSAVKLKMFGPLTRVTITWQPCPMLCRRFNVPEPHSGELNAQKNRKRTKNLIFEYQKHSDSDSALKPGLTMQKTDAAPEPTEQQKTTDVTSEVKLEPDLPSENVIPETSTSHTEEIKTEEPIISEVVDITERVDCSKNTDLFKAVFLSSSESESENEAEVEDEEKQRKQLIAASVLSEPLVPKIKSTKEGILSNIDFTKFRSPMVSLASVEEQKGSEPDEAVDESMYGPRLPTNVASYNRVTHGEPVVNCDEWVEKDAVVTKQKKHKKKHKKEKDRDKHKKKHKHKSKK